MVNFEEAFENIQGNLRHLPEKWKCWRTLSSYRRDWSFIARVSIRNRISEMHMAFDYLRSLDVWLAPQLTIKDGHDLLALSIIAAITEAAAIDLLIKDQKDEILADYLSEIPIYRARELLSKKGHVTKNWMEKLVNLHKARNVIHLQKKEEPIHTYTLDALNQLLAEFRNYWHLKY